MIDIQNLFSSLSSGCSLSNRLNVHYHSIMHDRQYQMLQFNWFICVTCVCIIRGNYVILILYCKEVIRMYVYYIFISSIFVIVKDKHTEFIFQLSPYPMPSQNHGFAVIISNEHFSNENNLERRDGKCHVHNSAT